MIKRVENIIKLLVVIALFGSCADAPDFSEVPSINFLSLSKLELNQGAINNDSILISIEFEDGDGDLGLNPSDIGTNLEIIDKRIDQVVENIKTPFVPIQGTKNGIRGTMQIKIFTTCCIFPNGDPPCQPNPEFPNNELIYEITLTDRAGNVSNKVMTDPINLICN